MSRVFTVERAQVVAAPLDQCFAYFSDPRRLPDITPRWLRFAVRRPPEDGIFAGCEIEYTIRWLGVPLRWTTLITDCDPPHRFVDTQHRGPYRRWWHEHRFVALGDRQTLMTDRVEYEMPLGILGWIAQPLVHRHLRGILDYRTRATAAEFSRRSDPASGGEPSV